MIATPDLPRAFRPGPRLLVCLADLPEGAEFTTSLTRRRGYVFGHASYGVLVVFDGGASIALSPAVMVEPVRAGKETR